MFLSALADALQPRKPDAIFPNNWFYCHHDGAVFLFLYGSS